MSNKKNNIKDFDEDAFKREWAIRGAGMGMHYNEMHGARCYHQWFVKPFLKELESKKAKKKLSQRKADTNGNS